jgi:putative membrane protein
MSGPVVLYTTMWYYINRRYNMWEWHEGMHWGFAFGGFWMILFWAAVISFGIWIVHKLTDKRDVHVDTTISSRPMDIAKERYAKGEITKEEFLQLKRDLIKS